MKIKAFLLVVIMVGLIACEGNERSKIHKLIDGVWSLENTSSRHETLDFNNDMTYKITGFINRPVINGLPLVETGFLTGTWELKNNEIVFLTTRVHLNSGGPAIDVPTVDGLPIGLLYGYQGDSIYQDTSGIIIDGGIIIDNEIIVSGETISSNTKHTPNVWTIEELNEHSLIVKSGTETTRYKKQ